MNQPVKSITSKKISVPAEVYSRVVGYHRPVNQWNKGKQAEFGDRKVSIIPSLQENENVSIIGDKERY